MVMYSVQMFERFKSGETPVKELGASRDYNIDLVPKFIMVCVCVNTVFLCVSDRHGGVCLQANGNLVKVLIHTDVTKYLEFKAVDGSFVFNKGRVEKVPATDWELPSF